MSAKVERKKSLRAAPKRSAKKSGQLIIIGGAEDKGEESEVLSKFVELSGGPKARILVMAVASIQPKQTGDLYSKVFKRLGAQLVEPWAVLRRDDANSRTAVEELDGFTGVFFTGGSQRRITSVLGGTRIDRALHSRFEKGLTLGGTSAGAAMMSSTMIIGGLPETTLRLGMVELAPGMEFLKGIIIDQHFEQRARLKRLLAAVAQHPHQLGLGVDENTAAIVSDSDLAVVGKGTVTVIDPGGLIYTNLAEINKNDIIALCGIRLHILPAGYHFDLQARKPVLKGQS